MGTTSARLAALSFATLTVISIGAILLTFARMIQPGESDTIAGMSVSLWYIFASTSAILSFALFALFTTLDSIRESSDRIADVLEDIDAVHPEQAHRETSQPGAAAGPIGGGAMRFRVTGIDKATGLQTSLIVEAKDKASATIRARNVGVKDISRVEYVRRSVATSFEPPAQSAMTSPLRPPAPSAPPPGPRAPGTSQPPPRSAVPIRPVEVAGPTSADQHRDT